MNINAIAANYENIHYTLYTPEMRILFSQRSERDAEESRARISPRKLQFSNIFFASFYLRSTVNDRKTGTLKIKVNTNMFFVNIIYYYYFYKF